MEGIATLLEPHKHADIEAMWSDLETDCDLKGIKITPVPHFSWQLVERYQLDRLFEVLDEFCKKSQPFLARTTGLGLFTGENPVIYIPLVKDYQLLQFHEALWKETAPSGSGISLHYSPENWIPHITLASEDVDRIKLSCALEKLAFQTYNWEFIVDHLVVGRQRDDETSEFIRRFDFGG